MFVLINYHGCLVVSCVFNYEFHSLLWQEQCCGRQRTAGLVDWKGYGTKNVLCSPYNSTVFSQECNVWPAVTNSHFPPVFISLFLLLRRHCHATLLFRRHEMNSAAEDSSSKNRSREEILIVPETLKNEMRGLGWNWEKAGKVQYFEGNALILRLGLRHRQRGFTWREVPNKVWASTNEILFKGL